MAIEFVKNIGSHGLGNSTTNTITVPAAGVAQGNVIIVRCNQTDSAGAVSSITDTRGNSYAQINTVGSSDKTDVWRAVATTALTSGNTIVITYDGKGGRHSVADEFSGLTLTGDGSDTATGSSTTPSVDIVPTNAEDVVFGNIMITAGGSDAFTEDADTDGGGSWNSLTTVASTDKNRAAYKITTSATTQTYNPSLGTSRSWGVSICALKGTAAAFFPRTNLPILQAVNRAAVW